MTQSDPAGAEEPRYGKRVSPEELEEILREQGIEPHRADADVHRAEPAVEPPDPFLRPSAPGPNGRRPRRRRLLAVGLVLLIVMPFVLSAVAVAVTSGGMSTSGTPLGEDGRVYLEAGHSSALYRARFGGAPLECTVTDPAGDLVQLRGLEGAEAAYLSFVPATSGTYAVSCAGGTADITVGPALKEDRVLIGGMLVLTAAGSGAVGLVVVLVGLLRR